MPATPYNKIDLKRYGSAQFTGKLGAAANPGAALELQADGAYDPTVSAKATAIKGRLLLLLGDTLQGKTISDQLSSGDNVQIWEPQTGDVAYILVKDGEAISVGEYLVEEGGTSGLFIAASAEAIYRFQALDAISPSGSNDFVRAVRV